MTSDANPPLIAGAGPVGLAAALFLSRGGIAPRIIDERTALATQSKALAVNPRTMDLLESTGVTEKMLAIGLPINAMHFHPSPTSTIELPLERVSAKHRFMLALSQTTTERLLNDALNEIGTTRVERGLKLAACKLVNEDVEVSIEKDSDGETFQPSWLLAADGSRSVARHALNVQFEGSSMPEPWSLADAPLRTSLSPNAAHIFFLDRDAFLFLLRVVDDQLSPRDAANPIWRVMSNRPDPLAQLINAEPTGDPVWASSFHVGHRLNETLSRGNAYFAGDAAHIHSPVGARGMNLGIEDAYVFAKLAVNNRLQDYSRLRTPIDRAVVQRVETISNMAVGASFPLRLFRSSFFPIAMKLPFIRNSVRATLTGLDHELKEN